MSLPSTEIPLAQSSLETPTVVRFRRDPDGLVVGHPYRFTTEGQIDWKSMLRSEDLYVKREFRDQVVKQYSKALSEIDLTTVEDRYLCVKLAGINRLANLRGMHSLTYPHVHVSPDKAAAVCEIEFIGNYETDGYPFICSSMASATPRSMDIGFIPYLETFAENRAFARCVKRALQINILSDIEVGGESRKSVATAESEDTGAAPAGGFEPHDKLAEFCRSQKTPISFETLRAAAIKHNSSVAATSDQRLKSDPALWVDWSSVPPLDAYLLMGLIKLRVEQNEAAAKGAAKS